MWLLCRRSKMHQRRPLKIKVNVREDSYYYNCGKEGHYALECPHDKITMEQQVELACGECMHLMNVQEEKEGTGDGAYTKAVTLMNVMMFNIRTGLDNDRLYLDNCSTVTSIKNKKYLLNVREAKGELKVC